MTSNDVTRTILKMLGIKKVGHTGTLDPGAAGILPVCLGKATKISDYLINNNKSYRFEMRLGIETDTLDAYGTIQHQSQNYPDETSLKNTLKKFIGNVSQIPPSFSAIKVNGNKLYEMARKGIFNQPEMRNIIVTKLELVRFVSPNRVVIDVDCSKGTYIRTLCKDIGDDLGCGAYMAFLLRTLSGRFALENAFSLDEIKECADSCQVKNILIPMENVLDQYNKVVLPRSLFNRAVNGNPISLKDLIFYEASKEPYTARVFCETQFIGMGILTPNNKMLNMEKVLV